MSQDGLPSGIHQSRRSRAAGVRGDECRPLPRPTSSLRRASRRTIASPALAGDIGAGRNRLKLRDLTWRVDLVTTSRLWCGTGVSGTPRPPAFDEAALLRARIAELEAGNARLRETLAAREELAAAELAARDAQIAALAAQVEQLRHRLGKDSSTSSRPPSSDGPYRKPRDRSLRKKTGRRPGKQPGAQSSTLRQSPSPDVIIECPPPACRRCGADLGEVPVLGVQKLQVFEAAPPPPPEVTEYQVQSKLCPDCGDVTAGTAPAGVTGRVQYGPLVHAKAALSTCAHYLPVARAARLVAALTGVPVSAGFAAGVRGKAAARREPFMDRVRDLLRSVPVLYADETPAHVAKQLHYVQVAGEAFDVGAAGRRTGSGSVRGTR